MSSDSSWPGSSRYSISAWWVPGASLSGPPAGWPSTKSLWSFTGPSICTVTGANRLFSKSKEIRPLALTGWKASDFTLTESIRKGVCWGNGPLWRKFRTGRVSAPERKARQSASADKKKYFFMDRDIIFHEDSDSSRGGQNKSGHPSGCPLPFASYPTDRAADYSMKPTIWPLTTFSPCLALIETMRPLLRALHSSRP